MCRTSVLLWPAGRSFSSLCSPLRFSGPLAHGSYELVRTGRESVEILCRTLGGQCRGHLMFDLVKSLPLWTERRPSHVFETPPLRKLKIES